METKNALDSQKERDASENPTMHTELNCITHMVHAPNEHKEEKHQHENSKMNPGLSTQWQKSSGQEERDENAAIDASCPPTSAHLVHPTCYT